MDETASSLKDKIREIPDFPEKGILFRDITTLLKDPNGLADSVEAIAKALRDVDFDVVVGPESRGFIFGMPAAYILNKGFVPARKSGKLPAETVKKSYGLEYGRAVVEIHKDAIRGGQRFALVDDLLATGGTSRAIAELIEESGGEVAAMVFLIELGGLGGRRLLEKYCVKSIVKY